MTLNVPPASVTPAQAATELRLLIKGAQGGSPPGGDKTRQRMLTERQVAEARMTQLEQFLDRLVVISRARKPSETRRAVEDAKAGLLPLLKMNLSQERLWADKLSSPSGLTSGQLRRAYELVQVLPTIENPPSGKAENTIRALTAIIKAHHGLLEEGPERLEEGDLPLVLLHQIKEKQPELWIPPEKVKKEPYALPFKISRPGEASDPFSPGIINKATGGGAYGPEPGDVSGWNGGNCTFDQAVATLRAVRQRYSTPTIVLSDANGVPLARAGKHMPVEFLDMPVAVPTSNTQYITVTTNTTGTTANKLLPF